MRPSIACRANQQKKVNFSSWQNLLKPEYLEQVEMVRAAIKKHTEVPVPASDIFQLSDDLIIGAKVTAQKTLSPEITLNIGTFLCIDDLMLSAFSNDNFFITEQAQQGNKTDNYTQSTCLDQRYWNYSQIVEDSSIVSLTHLLPTKNWRLQQASFLSSLAIRWITAHEIAHWLLGHCAITSSHALDEFTHYMIEIVPSSKYQCLSSDEKKCFELQADGLAFELMLHHAVFDDGSDTLWQIAKDPSGHELTDIDIIIYKIRSLITASASVVLLMERARVMSSGHRETAYPKPMTRLTNLLASAIRILSDYCGTTKIASDDRLVIDGTAYQERQQEFDALSMSLSLSLLDIGIIAGYLNINDSLFNNPSIDLWEGFDQLTNISQNIIFMNNLQHYMMGKESKLLMSKEQRQSFLEYQQLHPVQAELNKMLCEYALVEI